MRERENEGYVAAIEISVETNERSKSFFAIGRAKGINIANGMTLREY
jgi:2-succinyl-5-enolpyruvyl-6-hydroxy-3-cyclohexene-1-carboxylate synthase